MPDSPAPTSLAFNRRGLLVVDDDRMQRLLITQIAQRCGFSVEGAGSVAEALERLTERDYAVVVLDLSLGEGDGVEVLRHFAEQSHKPSILVISGFEDRIRDAAVRFAHSVGLATIGALCKPLNIGLMRKLLLEAVIVSTEENARAATSFSITAEDVADALDRGEIGPAYQPKVALQTGRIVSVEALARWQSPRHGWVPPTVFVDIAERSGLAGRLTRTMLRRAVAEAASWQSDAPGVGVAVNVPPSALEDIAWPDHVDAELAAAGLQAQVLTLEVTESTAMSESPMSGDVLTRLRIKGVNLSLDDFGTGYSSLLSLLRLPFSELKLDRSFVQRCDVDPYAQKIVRAMLSLAREFGMQTVAEGIETHAVSTVLRDARCDIGQGYLFGRAMPLDDLRRAVQADRAA